MSETLQARIDTLRRMTTAELKAEWVRVFGEPPRSGNVAWMRKRLIHRVQVEVLGDLSPEAKARLEYLMQFAPGWIPMGKRSLPNVLAPPATEKPQVPDARVPRPGSVITRAYQRRTIAVTVRDHGFEFDGTIYPSLTAVAKTVTGSHWNGNLFFGLTRRRKSA
ncbi:MAG: DUF2924 domain-containing protein [Acidobacteriia bacterium]|nr:DUF2924 domain-containing protein [Terriglobia bacterium]